MEVIIINSIVHSSILDICSAYGVSYYDLIYTDYNGVAETYYVGIDREILIICTFNKNNNNISFKYITCENLNHIFKYFNIF